MTTILTETSEFDSASAEVSNGNLWLSSAECENATGWVLKPEGLCQGDICVPVPSGKESDFVSGEKINISAFWQHLERPVLHDAAASTWMLGVGHTERSESLKSLQAPDFSLPDVNGDMHALSDYRGKRIFLTTWSSW